MRDQPRRPKYAHRTDSVLGYDIETIAADTPNGSFPPWPTHRPVAIGFAKADQRGGEWTFDLTAIVVGKIDEAALIREADRRMAEAATITSYNGYGFDALVLRMAAQSQRIFGLKALADHAHSNRSGDEHADLADPYGGYGGRRVSLAAICAELSVPVKTSTTGADVAALWKASETDRILDYVLEDAVATLCAWFAWSAVCAADEALVKRPLAALARHIEQTPELHHLEPFLACDLMQWARPKAVKADIAAALERVQQRLAREDEERSFDPLLLVRPPGAGKLHFARRLGELSNCGDAVLSFADVNSNVELAGNPHGFWHQQPCFPACGMQTLGTANPVIVIDEVEKASTGNMGDPVATLLGMLERSTTARYFNGCLTADSSFQLIAIGGCPRRAPASNYYKIPENVMKIEYITPRLPRCWGRARPRKRCRR